MVLRGSFQQSLPAFDTTVWRLTDDATLIAAESPWGLLKMAVQDSRLGDLRNPNSIARQSQREKPRL